MRLPLLLETRARRKRSIKSVKGKKAISKEVKRENEELIRERQAIYDLAKSNKHRIDKLEERQGELDKLVSAVAVIADEQKDMKEDMKEIKKDMKTDMAEIKKEVKGITIKPAKNWEDFWKNVLYTVVGIIIGYIFIQMGIG